MKKEKTIHHADDVTLAYLIDVMPKKLHKRLKLPGKFIKNYPTRIVRRDGSEAEMDWLMQVDPDGETLFEKILINVEFQSGKVDKIKIKIIADYKDYSKTYYGMPVLTIIVITNGYEQSELEYSRAETDILRPHYIYMDSDEFDERLNNIENHIDNLSEDEAIDIVLLPMFAQKNEAKNVTEKLTFLFSENKSITGKFRDDIGFALSLMVKKNFNRTKKAKELLKMLGGEVENIRARKVYEFERDYMILSMIDEQKEMREEFSKEISKRDNKISERDNEISKKDNEIAFLKAELKKYTE